MCLSWHQEMEAHQQQTVVKKKNQEKHKRKKKSTKIMLILQSKSLKRLNFCDAVIIAIHTAYDIATSFKIPKLRRRE